MTTAAESPAYPAGAVSVLSRRRAAFDLLLAVACVAITVVVHLGGSQSVAANRDPDALTVALTVLSVGIIALRRRFPLSTLSVALAGVLGLVVIQGTVGTATVGPFIATYTAVAYGSLRNSRYAIELVIWALVVTAILDPVDLTGEGAVLTSLTFAGVMLIATSTRARREAAEADIRAADQRAELERERADSERERAAMTATTERLRITRELHDVIGHAMSVMVVQAGAAGRLLDTADPDRARMAVTEIENTGRQAMNEMRNLLGVLRDGGVEGEGPPRAPAPTLEDVRSLVARVGHSGLPTSLAVHGPALVVPPGVGLAAYRIVQEALTNCLRHASATSASVDLTYSIDQIEIVVSDDGAGMENGTGRPVAGSGLVGMRERVATYGGDLVTEDRPEGGFQVRATLPVAVAR